MNSLHIRRQRIQAIVAKHGEADCAVIQTDLSQGGIVLSHGALAKLLRRMDGACLLERVRHGVYRLPPNHALRSLSMFQFTEERIHKALRMLGGIAKREEIDSELWLRQRGSAERPYDYNLVTRTLRESPKFQQDFGYGYWNLDKAERENVPLTGYWASCRIDDDLLAQGVEDSDLLEQRRTHHFEMVGTAFAEARIACGLDIESVVREPTIREELRKLELRAPSLWSEARRESQDSALADAAQSGQGYFDARNVLKTHIYATIYAMFEQGDGGVHRFVRGQFYWACAALLSVDAARLSRGITVPTPVASLGTASSEKK